MMMRLAAWLQQLLSAGKRGFPHVSLCIFTFPLFRLCSGLIKKAHLPPDD
jgi:hypothetical protein